MNFNLALNQYLLHEQCHDSNTGAFAKVCILKLINWNSNPIYVSQTYMHWRFTLKLISFGASPNWIHSGHRHFLHVSCLPLPLHFDKWEPCMSTTYFLCQYTLVISKQSGLHRNRQATWGRMPSLSNSRTPTLFRAQKPVRVFHNFDVVLGGPLLSLRGFPKSLRILSSWEYTENLNHLMYKTQNTNHKQKQPFVYDHALQTKQSWYLLLVMT
jgi:hypothetical protein